MILEQKKTGPSGGFAFVRLTLAAAWAVLQDSMVWMLAQAVQASGAELCEKALEHYQGLNAAMLKSLNPLVRRVFAQLRLALAARCAEHERCWLRIL